MKKLFFLTILIALMLTPMLHVSTYAQENIELRFSHIFPDERDVRRETIRTIADEFEAQNPGVTITIETTTELYEDVFNNALLAFEQGNAPHIIQVEDTLVQLAIDSQAFVKVSDYASEEQLASVEDILPLVRNFYNMDESFWGLPWNASNPMLYWNPTIFEAAGLDPNTPPTTFDEVMATCEAIMSAEIEGLTGCINWTVTSWYVEQWLSMSSQLFVNNDNGRSARPTEALFTSEAMINIMTWWQEMADKGYFIYSGQQQAYTPEGLSFVTRKTAMHVSSSAGISNVQSFGQNMGKFEAGFAPLFRPNADANNGLTVGGGSVWVLGGHSEAETQAAVDFAFFLINTENMSQWHQASGYYPVRQSSIDALTADGWFEENPPYAIPLLQVQGFEPNAANAGTVAGAYGQVRQALMDAIQSVIDGGEDPQSAMEAAKERADKALQEYNSFFE